MAPAMLAGGLERQLRAGAELDDGGDALAPALVGNADDDGVDDGGMGLEGLLDLLREDLLAAAVDAHRAAAQDRDPAVGTDGREVSRHAPARAIDDHERRRRLLGVV